MNDFKEQKGVIVEIQWRQRFERDSKKPWNQVPSLYRDFQNVLPTLRKWETEDVSDELKKKFKDLNRKIAKWLTDNHDEWSRHNGTNSRACISTNPIVRNAMNAVH